MSRYLLLVAVLLAGCAARAPIATFVQGKGSPALEVGVQQFENGQYAEASRSLQSALDLGLNVANERARAHKYLAFIHCAGSRLAQCRDHFTRALEAFPDMELEPSEIGHPTWGPAFRTVKAKR
jgi:Tfp pilus assembly protein PilF